MIRTYDLHRGPARELAIYLCPRHAEARRVLGWTFTDEREPLAPLPACDDCRDAIRNTTVLDRVIEAADAEALAAEPKGHATEDVPGPPPDVPEPGEGARPVGINLRRRGLPTKRPTLSLLQVRGDRPFCRRVPGGRMNAHGGSRETVVAPDVADPAHGGVSTFEVNALRWGLGIFLGYKEDGRQINVSAHAHIDRATAHEWIRVLWAALNEQGKRWP